VKVDRVASNGTLDRSRMRMNTTYFDYVPSYVYILQHNGTNVVKNKANVITLYRYI